MKDLVFSLLPFKEKMGYRIAKSHINQPIFLVGCARTGTTVFIRALGQHPDIRAAGREGALTNHVGGVAQHYCCYEVHNYVQNSTALKRDTLSEQLIKFTYETVMG